MAPNTAIQNTATATTLIKQLRQTDFLVTGDDNHDYKRTYRNALPYFARD